MKQREKRKKALICGSTQGIGLACAQGLAKAGMQLVLMARNKKSLQNIVSTLPGEGHDYIQADFAQPGEVKQRLNIYLQSNPSVIEVLVNNTGGPASGPITEASTDAFRKAFEMHIINNQQLVQALLPGMKKAGYGRIINIISTSVKTPLKNLGVSNTIRAAVASWSKSLANEIAQYGITVNNVLPGFTDTKRLSDLIKKYATQSGRSLEEETRLMEERVPAKRFAQPEEIAAAVVFLASAQAGYINGINLPVDGGRTPSL